MKIHALSGGVVIIALSALACSARGDYMMNTLSQGQSEIVVARGTGFDLDVVLATDAMDVHNSSLFRLSFSSPGFLYRAYEWLNPYENGPNGFDDSSPNMAELGVGGLVLTAELLSGVGYPVNDVDLALSNVVGDGMFFQGVLVRLRIEVPVDYAGPDTVQITAIPDTFANGFHEVPVTAGRPLTVNIPSPATTAWLVAGALAMARRRR